jgi:uncharacterized repeat protein (TIGR03803 family)
MTLLTSLAISVQLAAQDHHQQPPTYRVLYRFTGQDGAAPQAPIILDKAGNLYGTTGWGGDLSCSQNPGGGCGVVFKLDRTGKETVLHTFRGTDGVYPGAGLIRDEAGNLYGTTFFGGDFSCSQDPGGGCGVVFKLDRTGKETVLHNFTGEADGAFPLAALIRDEKGNLYGTTTGGGPSNQGTVFKLDRTGKESVLYSFTGGADGGYPGAGLIRDEEGSLYGTTLFGGTDGFSGVVFKLDRSGNETVLHSFTGGTYGSNPYAPLVRDSAGNIYGTAEVGGDMSCTVSTGGCGVVFKLTVCGKSDGVDKDCEHHAEGTAATD